MPLSPELRAWIVPGLAGTIASVDSQGDPQIVRVWSARAAAEPNDIDVYVLRDSASAFLDGLNGGARVALNLIEVLTYRSRMFKGSCRHVDESIDGPLVEACKSAMNDVFEAVGMGKNVVDRMLSHAGDPAALIALRVTVESVFDQSPKPGAGGRL
jgi:hypothetical protein